MTEASRDEEPFRVDVMPEGAAGTALHQRANRQPTEKMKRRQAGQPGPAAAISLSALREDGFGRCPRNFRGSRPWTARGSKRAGNKVNVALRERNPDALLLERLDDGEADVVHHAELRE